MSGVQKVGLTGFLDFVIATGTKRVTVVKELKHRDEYSPALDFYKPLRPEKTEGHYVFVSRGFTVLCGLAQIGVAILALAISGEKTSVVEQVMKVAGMTTGLLLGLFVLGRAERPVQSSAALGGLIAGFLAVFFVWLPEAFGPPIMAWPWFASLGLGTTWFVANILSLIRPRVSDGPASTLGDREPTPGIGPAR